VRRLRGANQHLELFDRIRLHRFLRLAGSQLHIIDLLIDHVDGIRVQRLLWLSRVHLERLRRRIAAQHVDVHVHGMDWVYLQWLLLLW
jgi:hypothetical protein